MSPKVANTHLFRLIFLCLLFLFFAATANAQQAILRGKVIDGEFGEPLLGATISIYENDNLIKGTATDLDGAYSLEIAPGTYQLITSYLSYVSDTITVEAISDEVVVNETVLYQEGTLLQEVIVKARASQSSELAVNLIKQKSLNTIDGISVDQIRRTGDNNVAGALQRVTGVSVEGGKYVTVRGLADRYSKTIFNGGELPALDPERNTTPLDIFPSNLVDNIIIYKNFTPDLPASFTGGLVDIQTKSHPEEFQLNFSASFGYNPTANGVDDFLTYDGGSTDFLGIDDGTRSRPLLVREVEEGFVLNPEDTSASRTITRIPTIQNATTDSAVAVIADEVARSFPEFYSFNNKRSGINQNYQLSFGNQFDLGGRPFGYTVGLSYRRSLVLQEDYFFQRINATIRETGPGGEFETVLADPNIITSGVVTEENVLWGGIIGLSYKLNEKNKLTFNYMHNQSGRNETRQLVGNDLFDRERDVLVYDQTMSFNERSLDAFQLKGDHVFGKLSVDWTATYTKSIDDQPDFRVMFFESMPALQPVFDSAGAFVRLDTVTQFGFASSQVGEPIRYYRELDEENMDVKLNLTLPFQLPAGKGKVKVGGAYTLKDRFFQEKQYNLNVPSTLVGEIDDFQFGGDPAALLALENFGLRDVREAMGSLPTQYNFNITYQEESNNRNTYSADQVIAAAYAMVEFPVLPKLRMIGGARYEITELNLETAPNPSSGESVRGKLEVNDILPSASLIYAINDKINLRAGYSRTLARPTFREYAPYEAFAFASGFSIVGNPNLERTLIDNYDLRFEFFPTPGELISISGFYKSLTDPIERRFDRFTDNIITLINAPEAEIYGAEIEVRKHFGFFGEGWEKLQLAGNFALMESEVPLDSVTRINSAALFGTTTRPLFAQPDYTLNAELAFIDNLNTGIQASVSYSIFGQRLAIVGQDNFNPYDVPRGLLNASLRKTIGERWAIRIRANNLLDPEYKKVFRFTEDGPEEALHENYRLGRSFSIGFSYNI